MANEKTKVSNIEHYADSNGDAAVHTKDFPILPSAERLKIERRIKLKLDIRLMSTIIVVFILNYIDRNALPNARLGGLEADLGLTDTQYQTCLAILYATYSPMQIPSQMILNKITRPSLYIGGCVIIWGLFSTLSGVVNSFGPMVACRLLLGIPEASFYCGSLYMLSRFYTRKELGQRACFLYVGLLLSNAFGSLIAAGILANMEGVLGHAAWRWIFWIEGAITMFIGCIACWALPDLPRNTRFFSPEERHIAQARIAEDAGEADEDATGAAFVHGLKLAAKDYRVWLFAIGTCAQLLGLSYTNFFPTLVKTLGYGNTETLLLTAPPWILTAIVCVLNGWHSDRKQERYFHLTWTWWVTLIGYILMMSTLKTAARYVSLFFLAVSYAGFALTLPYVANAIPRPPGKRAAAFGMVNGIGNLGNLMGSFVWKASWGPSYRIPAGICFASLFLAICIFGFIRYTLIRDNKKLDELASADKMTPAAQSALEKFAQLEDITLEEAKVRQRNFRYVY